MCDLEDHVTPKAMEPETTGDSAAVNRTVVGLTECRLLVGLLVGPIIGPIIGREAQRCVC